MEAPGEWVRHCKSTAVHKMVSRGPACVSVVASRCRRGGDAAIHEPRTCRPRKPYSHDVTCRAESKAGPENLHIARVPRAGDGLAALLPAAILADVCNLALTPESRHDEAATHPGLDEPPGPVRGATPLATDFPADGAKKR